MTRLVKIGNEIIDVDQVTAGPSYFVSFADGTVSNVVTSTCLTPDEQTAQAAKLQADMLDRIKFVVPRNVQEKKYHG